VTYLSQRTFEDRLRRELRGSRQVAVVGIGDELNVRDRLGMLAAKEVDDLHLPTVRVFHAGTVPESVTGPIRRYKPDAIILLDAADMGARPGSVALIQAREVRARLLSTHALPLSVVMEFLAKDTGATVLLVGIQPDMKTESFAPASAEQAGLTRLVVSLFHILGEAPPKKGRRTKRPARTSRRL
jgi:hydrogenase 3 maturation protease